MKESILVLLFFSVGMLLGHQEWYPAWILGSGADSLTVYIMLVAVGMGLGFDAKAWRILQELRGWVLMIPIVITVGTFLGGVVAWALIGDMSFRDVMAVSAGFGYYSLSSMLITRMGDPSLGSMSLIANMVRELSTLLLAPLMARYFGGLGPLAGAGAASDTCLSVIIRTSGERNAILAVFSGMVLTVAVPIFITLIFALG